MPAPDTRQPIFDPGMDVATVVFSHVRCVQTRVNLTLVSKLWRDASKTAAAYPLVFDFDAFSRMPSCHMTPERTRVIIYMMDNDEALSLPYDRVVGLLGEAAKNVCEYSAMRGSVRLLKWTQENNLAWGDDTCHWAAENGHLSALQYLHENGCPWNSDTCYYAALHEHWDCLQYLVDNKCPGWDWYAEGYAEHLR